MLSVQAHALNEHLLKLIQASPSQFNVIGSQFSFKVSKKNTNLPFCFTVYNQTTVIISFSFLHKNKSFHFFVCVQM